jgi:hypothetical protein
VFFIISRLCVAHLLAQALGIKTLCNAVFLMFFEVWISQLLLKQHEHIMVAAERPGDIWTWRLCRMLHMNVVHMAAATQQANNRESLAVSLRTIEVFTSWEISQRILGESKVQIVEL